MCLSCLIKVRPMLRSLLASNVEIFNAQRFRIATDFFKLTISISLFSHRKHRLALKNIKLFENCLHYITIIICMWDQVPVPRTLETPMTTQDPWDPQDPQGPPDSKNVSTEIRNPSESYLKPSQRYSIERFSENSYWLVVSYFFREKVPS